MPHASCLMPCRRTCTASAARALSTSSRWMHPHPLQQAPHSALTRLVGRQLQHGTGGVSLARCTDEEVGLVCPLSRKQRKLHSSGVGLPSNIRAISPSAARWRQETASRAPAPPQAMPTALVAMWTRRGVSACLLACLVSACRSPVHVETWPACPLKPPQHGAVLPPPAAQCTHPPWLPSPLPCIPCLAPLAQPRRTTLMASWARALSKAPPCLCRSRLRALRRGAGSRPHQLHTPAPRLALHP